MLDGFLLNFSGDKITVFLAQNFGLSSIVLLLRYVPTPTVSMSNRVGLDGSEDSEGKCTKKRKRCSNIQ